MTSIVAVFSYLFWLGILFLCVIVVVGIWANIKYKKVPVDVAQKAAGDSFTTQNKPSLNVQNITLEVQRPESWLSKGLKLYGAYHLLGFGKDKK